MASAMRLMRATAASRWWPWKSMNPVMPHICSAPARCVHRADDLGGIAADQRALRHFRHHHRSGGDDAPCAHIGHDDGTLPHPRMASDTDRVKTCRGGGQSALLIKMLALAA